MSELDVLIIGAGTAGQTAAYELAAEGYRVAVAEQSSEPGGICALHGCQAKKYFYEVAELVAKSKHLQGLGVASQPVVAWQEILEAKNRFTSGIPDNTVATIKGNGIQYLNGKATFVDSETVQIGEERLRPRYVIIATGATPMELPIAGNELLANSNDFLAMDKMVDRVTLVGGGFISFEFAHFAARLGARPEEVVILEVMDRPLGPFDKDMVELLVEATRSEGITVRTGVSISSIERSGQEFTVSLGSGESYTTDLVVHGAGRIPNIDFLNLEAAGVDSDRRGIEVDSQMRTSNAKVFAVGDCAAAPQLARVADREALVAAATIVATDDKETAPAISYEEVPAVLFTYPQLGMVGKTEEQLADEGTKYWRSFDKNLSWPTYRRIGMQHAAYKVLVDSDNRILGAHILGDNVTGLLNAFKQAMLDKVSVPDLHRDNIMSPYPSRESDITYMLSSLLE